MIPLSGWIHEKLADESLDDSPMKKLREDHYKGLLESYTSELKR